MCDEGRWGHRHVSLAAVPRVAVYLMEAAVSGERMVETWIAAMETAVLCTSINHGIAPNGGEAMKEKLSSTDSHHLRGSESIVDFLVYLSSRVCRRLLW